MKKWYMLTLVGKDQPGIVARITETLLTGDCNLGEASMIRLGVNFTMMLMVEYEGSEDELKDLLAGTSRDLNLHQHVDMIDGELHSHLQPDVCISVYGADRSGIVARVASLLADAGVNILQLESSVGGTTDKPIYIMQIDAHAAKGVAAVEKALTIVKDEGINVSMTPIDTMVG